MLCFINFFVPSVITLRTWTMLTKKISACCRILNDTTFASNIAGVLVESGPDIQNKLKGKVQLSTR